MWWWRGHFRLRRPLVDQSFSLKESQDPLLMLEPPADPGSCLTKAREAFTRPSVAESNPPGIRNGEAEFLFRRRTTVMPLLTVVPKDGKAFCWILTGAPFPFLFRRIRQEHVDKH